MHWQLQSYPRCTHHVFLSHCREDREWLALPLFAALKQVGIIPWIDRHDYPYGRSSFGALRDGILRCRHTIFLVSVGMLAQSRGWGIVELAWADLLQENLRESGGSLQNVVLPLFFLPQNNQPLLHSAWQSVRDRAAFHHPANGNEVAWAVGQIRDFLVREARLGLENAQWLEQDSRSRIRLQERPGLIERITALYPTPAPPPN